MSDEFHFYTQSGLVRWTGVKVDNLKTLLNGLKTVPGSSIFYHIHHALFRRHFTTAEFMNDFALWVYQELREDALAEKMAGVDPIESLRVRETREKLMQYIDNYIGELEFLQRVPPGKEFYFCSIRSFFYPLGYSANDLESFLSCIKKVNIDSIFHHFIGARSRLGEKHNNFSKWLGEYLGEWELAEEINNLSPYMYDLWTLKNKIIMLIEKRLNEK